ncbi:MAG: hypothetical protein QWI36_01740 [Wolbachia endosymbiont of Tyrophagus putrescentiae]|nr:hypothetical protein [Wolbachia endosymbiont of Tyrophagus putrescentiae]
MVNTLRDYIAKHIGSTLGANISNKDKNKYDKLYRELLNKIEELIKQAIKQDESLKNTKFSERLLYATAKKQISDFLSDHTVKEEVIGAFEKYDINEGDHKILEESKNLVKEVEGIDLSRQSKEGGKTGKKTLAKSVPPPRLSSFTGNVAKHNETEEKHR